LLTDFSEQPVGQAVAYCLTLEDGTEMSVNNYQYILRKNPEESRRQAKAWNLASSRWFQSLIACV